MKSSLALLVFCVVLALVSNTEAGKGGKGGKGKEKWAKMMNGKCKGLMNFKEDEAWKTCASQAKEGADGDEEDMDMDNEGGGAGPSGGGGSGDGGCEGGKHKGKGKGRGRWMKKMMCVMKAKNIIVDNKFQIEAAKAEITSKLSDQPETAAAVTKILEECATEKKLGELNFPDEVSKETMKDSGWKALGDCKHKSMKPCMDEK